jgi:hypothetical protein
MLKCELASEIKATLDPAAWWIESTKHLWHFEKGSPQPAIHCRDIVYEINSSPYSTQQLKFIE